MLTFRPAVSARPERVAIAATLLALACGGGPDDPGGTPSSPATDTPALTRTVILQGLSSPWDIAVAADGAIFFTEKCRGLSVRHANGTVTRLFGTTGLGARRAGSRLPKAERHAWRRARPALLHDRTLYVYMASNLNTPTAHQSRGAAALDAGYTSAGNRVDIVTDIAFKNVGNAVGGSGAHSGGRIALRARRLPLHHHR